MNNLAPASVDPSHRNEDPITNEPGAHPVATGVGAASGGAAGAALGMAVGGPIGGAIGAVIGAFAGGFGGHAVGETIEPTELGETAPALHGEPVHWHEIVPSGLPSYDEIALRAWCLYEAEGKPEGQDVRHWLEAERSLMAETTVVSPS